MTLIKGNTSKFQTGATGPVKVPTTVTPPVTKPESKPVAEVAPQETFVATPTVAAPEKVDEPKLEKVEQEAKLKLAVPRPGSDMALMLENIEAAKIAGGEIKSNANGTLAVLQEFPAQGIEEPANPKDESNKSHSAHPEERAHGRHGHSHSHLNHGLLGGHLSTEVVEQAGHHAQHATTHGVEAVSQGAGHVQSHEVGHAAHAVAHAKAEGAHEVAEATQDLVQASQPGHELSQVTSEAAKHGSEVAGHLSTGLQTALGVSAAASVGIGGVMLYTGGKELAKGVKEKDGEKIAEGVGGLAVGARSVAASTVMASMLTGSSTVAQVASVASQALTPLGIVHGAIDVGLGVKDLVKGDKIDGLVKVGFGASVIAGAAIGGLPLTLAALGFLGVKVGRSVMKSRAAKKAAAQAQQSAPVSLQPSPPQPAQETSESKDSKT